MKVKDLQALLEHLDPEMPVVVEIARYRHLCPMNIVQLKRSFHRSSDDLYDHEVIQPEKHNTTVVLLTHK
jgi:hypothetical protein